MSKTVSVIVWTLAAFSFLNVLITIRNISLAYSSSFTKSESYQNPTVPIPPLPPALMTFSESFQYAPTTANSSSAWFVPLVSPPSYGWSVLGPNDRIYVNGLFHQMHCLWAFHEAFLDKMRTGKAGGHGHGHGHTKSSAADEEMDMKTSHSKRDADHTGGAGHAHLSHCLSYLRQTLLCKASESIEKGDFLKRNFTSHRLAGSAVPPYDDDDGSMVCEDWTKVFDWAENNFVEFLKEARGNETYLDIFTTGQGHVTH